MKKIPQLYVKKSNGRYEEYKIPEHDISNTLYSKVNGRYEPACMCLNHELDEGVWVVTKRPSICGVIRGTYLRESFHLDKASDIERFPLSKIGHIKKVSERIIDELRLGNTDTRVMTNNELVNLVVGLVYKYNEDV